MHAPSSYGYVDISKKVLPIKEKVGEKKKVKLPPPRMQEDKATTSEEKRKVPPGDKEIAPKKDKPLSKVRDWCLMCMSKIIFLSL